MKKKSLLLLIPFAAAALAGCTPATKPCSDAVISFTDGDSKTIKVGEDFQIPYSMDVEKCDGELKWESSDTAVATVDSSGKVHGVAVGTAVITVNGKTFNIKVEKGDDPHPVLKEVTPAEAIALMEEAGEGVVVQPEVIVVGTISNPSKDSYNQWYADFDNSELKLSGASYAGSESIVTGVTIKVKGYLEKFEGKYKIGYLPASASPTGEKYIPEITSVTPPQGKAVVEVVDVKSSPASVAVGGTVSPSSVTLNVKLEDGTSSTAKATKVEVNTSVAAESVEGKAWYNELGPVAFNIKVVAEAPSSMKEAYLAAEALTDSKAKTEEFTFSGVIVGKRTNKNDKGEVEFFVQDGSYAIDLFNPTNKDSLAVGNRVTITSTLCNYNGTIETTSDLKSVVVDGNADLPEATFIDSAATLSSTKVSVLANTEGVIKTIPTYSATADAKVIVTVGSDDITVFFKKNFIADFESIYKSLAVGDKITLTNGVVGDFKGRQILVIDGTQITKGETPDPGEPAINLDKYSATIAKDGEVTLTATVYNSEESVSWSVDSGEGNVAITPNGKTCVVKGVVANSSAVVKATLGTTGKSKTCNVTVKADSPVIEGIVLDFAELSEVSGTVEGVSYVSDKASGASAPAYNSSNKELRLYAKNTFTISGTNITKITFDYNGCYTEGEKDPCHKATGDIVSASVGSVSAGVWTGSADSVTFTMSDSGQVHVHKVGVVCAAAKTVSELTVKTQPDKVAYNEGESFSAAGLVLHAVYSDSSEEDITSGWTISPAGALAPTDNKVVVSYGGKSVDVAITVTARELLSIAIETQPAKVEYVEGESFDPTGMVVKATYNIGDPAVVTNYTYSPNGALALTDNEVVVSFGGKTASVAITVTEAPEVLASKFTFTAKDSFEETGKTGASMVASGTIQGYEADRGVQWNKNAGVVTISDFPSDLVIKTIKVDASTNSTASDVTVSAKVGANDFGTAYTMEKANHVDVTFEGSASGSTITINTTASAAKSAYIKSVEIQWEKGEPVDPAVNSVTVSPKTASLDLTETTSVTLSATVNAVGGASEDVVWSVETGDDYVSLPEIKTGSSIVVTAAAEGTAVIKVASAVDSTKYDTCEVTVSETPAPEQVLDRIEVATAPSTTVYTEGQTFDKTGLTVTAHYTNGKADATIGAASLVCTPAGALSESDTLITISYTEGEITKTCTQAITVNKASGEKGTETNPYNIADLWTDVCSKLTTDKSWSEKSVYVRATVKTLKETTPEFTIGDNTSENVLIVYKPSTIEGISVGDVVLVHAYIENYAGKMEMTGWNSYPAPVVDEITKGTVSVGIDSTSSANAHVNLSGETGVNGSSYSFSVTVDTNYEIVSVKVNGVDATKGEGNAYSFIVNGPSLISVMTKAQGQADPVTITKTMSQVVEENDYTVSSGNDVGTITDGFALDSNISVSIGKSDSATGNTGSFWSTAPNNDLRLYKNDVPVFTISAANGKTIKTINITFSVSNNGTFIYDGSPITTGTNISINDSSASFTVGVSSGTKNGQVRITSIQVIYE